MRRLIVLLVFALACGGSSSDGPNGPVQSKIRVSPQSATILVGGTQALGAALLDDAGDSTGLATVTWTSSASGVASVSADGVAMGHAAGVTTITATTGDGARDSARITVVENVCDGIAHAHLQGTADFTFTYATTLGSVQYVINDTATMSFTANSSTAGPNNHLLWFVPATGNGSEHETRTDHESDQVETIDGDGPLVVDDINLSHVIIDVDLSACTYTLEGNPYIDITENPGGDLGPSWIGWFRTAPAPVGSGSHSVSLATHSVLWMGTNYATATGWYVPLGFSSDYFGEGAPDDGTAGTLTIDYSLGRVP